jgi:hypothetical protein
MSDLDSCREILTSILAEWDRAEGDIKLAEQVCLRVSEPSIKELRYAGRRVTEAIHNILSGGDVEHVKKLLYDADFDCHRARHDAVDAATSKMASDIRAMTDRLGYNPVLKACPNFPEFFRNLRHIRRNIVKSRERGRQDRDSIYESIESVDLKQIVSEFEDITEAEEIMRSLAKAERRHTLLLYVVIIVEFVGILAGFRHSLF